MKETSPSLGSTLQLKRSLGGYSHREHCRAPDRINSSHYKDSKTILIKRTRRQFSSEGLEDTCRSKDSRIKDSQYKGLKIIPSTKDSSTLDRSQLSLFERYPHYMES